MFLDKILERNRTWSGQRKAEPLPAARSIPLAIVACYDPRLDDMLRPALGLAPGEGFMIRTAGAVVTPATLRSLAVAVYLFEVHQVLVVGHSSCKMASFPASDFINAFRGRGVRRSAFGDSDLRAWAGAIPSPRQGVLSSVEAIGRAPMLPADLEIAGTVLDDTTGKLKTVFKPEDSLPLKATAAKATAAGTEPDSKADEPAPTNAAPTDVPPPSPQDGPLAEVLTVFERLSRKRGLSSDFARLRSALEKERHPGRQLVLVQQFIKGAAAESPRSERRSSCSSARRPSWGRGR